MNIEARYDLFAATVKDARVQAGRHFDEFFGGPWVFTDCDAEAATTMDGRLLGWRCVFRGRADE